jgi:peptidoglycan/xylan/chitin deacetylase (PgdA/CDA1 family)
MNVSNNLGKKIIGKLSRKITRLQRKLAASKSLILMYHRVTQLDVDPWNLCVNPGNFSEHLEVLQKYFLPLSLNDLVESFKKGKIPSRAVVLTFDDGYSDNFNVAQPILEKYSIPATFFISTNCINEDQEFWWDELEKLILSSQELPEKLLLKINQNCYTWQLDKSSNLDQDQEHWLGCDSATCKVSDGSRLALYYSIYEKLRPLSENKCRDALTNLRSLVGANFSARPSHRTLELQELLELGKKELVEIGAHTVTHPFLPAHSLEKQLHEIRESKTYLEEILDRPITSFAYPYGFYDSETVNVVRECGFQYACSTISEPVWRGSKNFELPRFGVENWNGDEFLKRLLSWFSV